MLGEVAVGHEWTLARGLTVSAGPFYRWRFTDPELDEAPGNRLDPDDEPTIMADLRPYGVGGFQQYGFRASGRFERVREGGNRALPTGWRVDWRVAAMPAVSDQLTAMASTSLRVAGSFSLPADLNLTVRTGVEKRIGGFPFMDAAFLGGRRLLRGYQKQRFAGDAAAWSQVELHLPGPELRVAGRNLTIGPVAHADAGRVYLSGVSEGGWHFGRGFGLWATDRGSGRYASVLLSWGDAAPRAYFNLGIPLLRR